jgi:hypothetical protein
MDKTQVIERTRRWIRDIVVGLNLCPFAHQPLADDTISYRVSEASDEQTIYQELLQALDAFLAADSATESTGLFICANGLARFDDYNQFLDWVDQALVEGALEEAVQVASFHPDYQFADSAADDPANFTNRSPYPMFHFIRQDSLSQALESFPDPQSIPERNIALLRNMGWREMAARLAEIRSGD